MPRRLEARRGKLKQSSQDFLGRCPRQDDREASLVVGLGKNLWHCSGCQIDGGPIDWLMRPRHESFQHVIELLKADPALGKR